jgi:hypothetical protein
MNLLARRFTTSKGGTDRVPLGVPWTPGPHQGDITHSTSRKSCLLLRRAVCARPARRVRVRVRRLRAYPSRALFTSVFAPVAAQLWPTRLTSNTILWR